MNVAVFVEMVKEMSENSIQVGWKWSNVKDLEYWQIPDGFIMNLPYRIGDPPARILDLGCGIGRHIVYFSSLGYQVTGMDISEEAVTKTKEWLKKEGFTADVKEGKMTKIEEIDDYFTLVIAYNVIYHAYKKDIIKTISEIYRVLKPGGFFFGTILTKDPNQPFYGSEGIIDDQTLIKQEEPEKGIPHFFSYIEDILKFFKSFEIIDLFYNECYSKPFTLERINNKKGNGHYIIFTQKPKKQ